MEINPRILRKALSESLGAIQNQIEAVGHEAELLHIAPSELKDTMGNLMLTPLLVAQAQVLHALTLLQTGR